jgi:hypothetical protein
VIACVAALATDLVVVGCGGGVFFLDKGGCPHQHWGTAAMATQLAGATTSLEERVLLSGFSPEFAKKVQLVVNDVCWGAAGRKVCAYRHCGVVVFV